MTAYKVNKIPDLMNKIKSINLYQNPHKTTQHLIGIRINSSFLTQFKTANFHKNSFKTVQHFSINKILPTNKSFLVK